MLVTLLNRTAQELTVYTADGVYAVAGFAQSPPVESANFCEPTKQLIRSGMLFPLAVPTSTVSAQGTK